MTTIESLMHEGQLHYRINPATIKLDAMDTAQKVTDVFAFQLPVERLPEALAARVDVADLLAGGKSGDWLVCDLASVEPAPGIDILQHAVVKLLPDDKFRLLYRPRADGDGSTYSDYDPIWQGAHYTHLPVLVKVARVPFNFVLKTPWGQEQFIRAGGYVVASPHSHGDLPDIYGVPGAKGRKAGHFERAYTKIGDGNEKAIDQYYKRVIAADRSPIAGIQFNLEDLERAYNRIGKAQEMEKFR